MTINDQKPTNFEAVGKRLRTLREALGVTLGDISNKLKATCTTLDLVELGLGRPSATIPLINAVLEYMQADPAMDNYVWNGGEIPASLEARVTAQYRFEFQDYEHARSVVYPFSTAATDVTVGLRFETYREMCGLKQSEVAERCGLDLTIVSAFETEQLVKMQRDHVLFKTISELEIPPEVVKYLKEGGPIPRYFHMDAAYRGVAAFRDYEHRDSVDTAPSQFYFETAADLALATKRLKTVVEVIKVDPDRLMSSCGVQPTVFMKLLSNQLSFGVGKSVFDSLVIGLSIPSDTIDYLYRGGVVPNALLEAARHNRLDRVHDYANNVIVTAGTGEHGRAVGNRLIEVLNFCDTTHADVHQQAGIHPNLLSSIEKGAVSWADVDETIRSLVVRMRWPAQTSRYILDGDAYISYSHFLEESVQETPEPYRPAPGELEFFSRDPEESQLDRIERLVTLLQEHRGELTVPEKPVLAPFKITIPKGATHYEDSEHSHDGALRFYKVTEDNWFFVWGMIYEVNALGWTAADSNRSQLRLTKLP